jgi:hypothetical protein
MYVYLIMILPAVVVIIGVTIIGGCLIMMVTWAIRSGRMYVVIGRDVLRRFKACNPRGDAFHRRCKTIYSSQQGVFWVPYDWRDSTRRCT